ncbi:LURP-one-related/scramblase family protein [Sinanaerobacter chloroacetimidivorans]|jgi:uncharacterized protein YxjI|uniref:LURP-one-related family protein n=1 Tax=Sinanaerobacter chloroacetimidivorans TaxID=2818044 RepID=A0A8J7W607_9FIRM|nr:LURP-one-related family protein [Sinanaerobacter chloroacetimidivorans]MBR0599968.1 LURP-one-related family protein [Sinanaerobacter chloroacetimidivorans]
MKLYIKQKVFSWADKFFIKDEFGNDKYYVEGEIFSWGHKLHLYDEKKEEVAFIKQKVMSWLPKFEVYIDDALAVEVVKEFTFFKPRYSLRGTDWSVEGDFWDHNYMITNQYGQIASITKAWFSWGDSYELEIAEGVNEILAVATVMAIDCVMEAQNNSTIVTSNT